MSLRQNFVYHYGDSDAKTSQKPCLQGAGPGPKGGPSARPTGVISPSGEPSKVGTITPISRGGKRGSERSDCLVSHSGLRTRHSV